MRNTYVSYVNASIAAFLPGGVGVSEIVMCLKKSVACNMIVAQLSSIRLVWCFSKKKKYFPGVSNVP